MNISVIGTSYVGLITGACFAESGNNVICVDVNSENVRDFADDRSPLKEPGLFGLILKNLKEGRLCFTSDLHHAVKASFIIFIAVGTEIIGDSSMDRRMIINVSRSIGRTIDDYKIIVIKSIVPFGTTELVRQTIRQFTDVEFDVAYNPEYLNEGSAIDDFMRPDWVVIGFDKPSVAMILKRLYSAYIDSNDGYIFAPIKSAEIAAYDGIQYLEQEFAR